MGRWETPPNGNGRQVPAGQNIFPNSFGTSVVIEVTSNISYFVRGVGGCVPANGACQEFKITLDDQPPVPSCSDDITVMVGAEETETAVDYTIPGAVDNCPGGVKIELMEGIQSGGIFPLGVTTVTYRFTDARGNSSTCSFDVNVEVGDGPTGPVITCPENIIVDAEPGKCGAIVNYQEPTAIGDLKVELTAGLGSGSFFPVGTTTEVYSATDGAGNSMSCKFNVIVKEIENGPPVITLSKNSVRIWPPNGQKFTVNIIDYIKSVSGNCSISIDDVVISKVTSDEERNGTGDGNTLDDIVISDDCQSVDLRAERKGNGNGRVYTIYLAVSDGDGNIDKAQIIAYVPHDNGKGNGNDGDKDDDHKGKDEDDKKEKRKGNKKGKNGGAIDDGPKYVVQGCAPSSERTPQQPVFYSYTEEVLTTSINPYPNPFINTLDVKYTAAIDDEVSLDLYSLSGMKTKQLFKGDVNAKQTYTWRFDVYGMEKQIYLLVIKGKRTYAIRKVIKN